MMTYLSLLLRHWKAASCMIFAFSFIVLLWLAQVRGGRIDALESRLQAALKTQQAQAEFITTTLEDQKDRHAFAQKQSDLIHAAPRQPARLDPGLRRAYDSLRARQQEHTAR